MKKILYTMLLGAGLGCSSCTEYPVPEEQLPEIPQDTLRGLKLNTGVLWIEASGDPQGVVIHAVGGEWSVRALEEKEWLEEISPASGGEGNTVVGVKLRRNEGMRERSVRLLVAQPATGLSDTLEVRQYTYESRYSRRTDSLALATLFKALEGEKWKTPWKLRYPMNTWKGVTLSEVNGEMRVTKLWLTGFKVLRDLPNELGELKELRELKINNSEFQGRVPNGLASLRKLERLDVAFAGHVNWFLPDLSDLKSLRYLNVGALNIDMSSMAQLWKVVTLDTLIMTGFELQGKMPEGIAVLRGLRYIDWNGTRISGLPEDIGQLTGLKYLNLRGCSKLEILPESFGRLSELEYLNLYSCRELKTIPESFGGMKRLKTLDLSYCAALKKIPESLGEMTGLTALSFRNCESLEALPQKIGHLQGITVLDLANCSALIRLPESFSNLPLSVLNLESCRKLEGLPESIGQMQTLRELRLNYCDSFHMMPAGIGELKQLKKIELYSTALTSLPPEFVRLSGLEVFIVTEPLRIGEGIRGVAAELLGGLANLTELEIPGHNLTGGIDWLLNLPRLTKIDISRNRLSGTVSDELLHSDRWTTFQPEVNIYPQQPGFGFEW